MRKQDHKPAFSVHEEMIEKEAKDFHFLGFFFLLGDGEGNVRFGGLMAFKVEKMVAFSGWESDWESGGPIFVLISLSSLKHLFVIRKREKDARLSYLKKCENCSLFCAPRIFATPLKISPIHQTH